MARPKIHDKEQVLTGAMFKFWHQGYEATGIRDLEQATGLPASSLYHNFGNKEALFLRVLDFYIDSVIRPRVNKYLRHKNPVLGIQQFFTTCFTDLPEDTNGIACLMVNTMAELAFVNDDICARLEIGEKELKREFRKTVERAKAEDQISSDIDTNNLVNLLLLTLNGLLLSSKVVKNKRRMVTASKQALSFLLKDGSS